MPVILIIEDLPDAAERLACVARQAFPEYSHYWATDLASAHDWLKTSQPVLALVDLGLPDGSGISLIETLTQQYPSCISIVATITADDTHLFAALQAGARGYLLKEQPVSQLALLLRGIADGQPPLSPAIARRLLQYFQSPSVSSAHRALAPSADSDLTAREKEILTLLARGLRLADIAELLSISRHTVGDHVKHIYRKLNISSRAEAALRARSMGLA